MKQTIKCKYCGLTLMEIDKKDFEKAQFPFNVDLIKKCPRCSKNQGQNIERRFSITDILKSTDIIIRA